MKDIVNKNKKNNVQTKFKFNDGTFTTNKSLISEKFNNFFVNIGPNLAKKIPNQELSPLCFMKNPSVNSMFLYDVTLEELNKVISSLKNGAPDYDEINASVLKIISSCVDSPLVYLCNR